MIPNKKMSLLLVTAVSMMILGSYGALAQPGAENDIDGIFWRARDDTGNELDRISCIRSGSDVVCQDGDGNDLSTTDPTIYIENYGQWHDVTQQPDVRGTKVIIQI